MANDYVKTETAKMTLDNGKEIELLWGDLLRDVVINGTDAQVTARGKTGKIPASALRENRFSNFILLMSVRATAF